MRNKSIFILLFLCLLLFPFQTHAEEKVSVKTIGGKNKVTIKVDSSLKKINCVEGTIRGGRKQFKRSRFFKETGHEYSMAKAYLKKIDGISHHFAY